MHRAPLLRVPTRAVLSATAGALALTAVVHLAAADGTATAPAGSTAPAATTVPAATSTSTIPSPSTSTTISTGTTASTTTGTAAATPQAEDVARTALARRIEARASGLDAGELDKSTNQMIEVAHRVDAGASADADAKIAGRLATQFHMDASALASEKQTLDISWGNLMIAHTLSASATDASSASVANLVALHKDGMGWGKIAAGLGFKLGPAVSAIQAEGRVAAGESAATGKVSHIAAAGKLSGDPDAAGSDAAKAAKAASAANAARGAADHAANGAARAAEHAADAAAAHVDAGAHLGSAGGK